MGIPDGRVIPYIAMTGSGRYLDGNGSSFHLMMPLTTYVISTAQGGRGYCIDWEYSHVYVHGDEEGRGDTFPLVAPANSGMGDCSVCVVYTGLAG